MKTEKLSRSGLQNALNSLAAANARALKIRNKIYAHCEEVYGFNPGEVDNDTFIDSCDSGCGASDGMDVDEFEASMLAAIRQHSRG